MPVSRVHLPLLLWLLVGLAGGVSPLGAQPRPYSRPCTVDGLAGVWKIVRSAGEPVTEVDYLEFRTDDLLIWIHQSDSGVRTRNQHRYYLQGSSILTRPPATSGGGWARCVLEGGNRLSLYVPAAEEENGAERRRIELYRTGPRR